MYYYNLKSIQDQRLNNNENPNLKFTSIAVFIMNIISSVSLLIII